VAEPEEMIRVRGVSKTYRIGEVDVHALKDVSLNVQRGEFLVITGRNGAGKSTLLHQIAGLDQPDRGEIVVDGQDMTALTEQQRGRLRLEKLGYIFQEHALIAELTALENVMLPAMVLGSIRGARRRAEALLARVELSHVADHLPMQLSGGEQQKVAIARALVNSPAILYADEPTASLDTVAARDVLETFTSLNREEGHTIIMVTHEEDEARRAKRRVQLSDGRIASDERVS
jgi:ABC-type lipoprotein export system ATPase subunit